MLERKEYNSKIGEIQLRGWGDNLSETDPGIIESNSIINIPFMLSANK